MTLYEIILESLKTARPATGHSLDRGAAYQSSFGPDELGRVYHIDFFSLAGSNKFRAVVTITNRYGQTDRREMKSTQFKKRLAI